MSEQQLSEAPARVPWLTVALVATCLLLQLFVWGESGRPEGVDLGEATAYFKEHPYLSPPPLLAAELGSSVQAMRRSFETERDRRGAPPIPEGLVRRRQEKLDDLVSLRLAELADRPANVWGARADRRAPATLLTHVAVHTGWLHLLGNGFLLIVLGFYLEGTWGMLLYPLVAVGAAGVWASVFAAANAGLDVPLVGTSGVLAALLGAFAFRLAGTWRDGAYGLVLTTGLLWLGVPLWIGSDWSLARLEGMPPDGSSTAALVAAFAFGFGSALAIRVFRFEEALVAPSREARLTRVSNPLLERAIVAQEHGRFEEAYAHLRQALEADPEDHDTAFAMWDVANALGRPAAAASAMLRVVRSDVRRGDAASAVDHWLELEQRGLSANADVTLLLKLAAMLKREQHPEAALNALRRALEQAEGPSTAVVASRVARESRELDAETAEEAAWRALGSVELDYGDRAALEELLGELHRDRDLRLPRRRAAVSPPAPPARSADPPDEGDDERPAPIDLDVTSRSLSASPVVPVAFQDEGLRVETPDGAKKLLPYTAVQAVSVVAVQGLGPKPVLIVDLVLNWMSLTAEPLRVVRMRGDRFDPRRLVHNAEAPTDALRAVVERLLAKTGATPLPDEEAALGRPFAFFDDLAAYQRNVLMVEELG